MWPWILQRLAQIGLRRHTLRGVILTHSHRDHSGSAQALQAMGLELMAHRQEVPYLTGLIHMPKYGPGRGHVLHRVERRLLPKMSLSQIRNLDTGEFVLGSAWQVLHAPGHTPGSLALWNANSGALLSGDTLTTSFGAPRGPHPVYTADLPRALSSAQRLLNMEPRFIYPGHGRVVSGSAFERVRFSLRESATVCGGSAA